MTKIQKNKTEKIWNARFTRIAIITVMFNMGQFMMNTLVPKYTDSMGATAAVVGIVSSMFAITSLGIRPISGPAMDYYKKNRLMSFALGLIIIAFIGYGLSNNVAMVIVSRLIHGMGIGIAAPLSMAMASSALPESKLASGLGIFFARTGCCYSYRAVGRTGAVRLHRLQCDIFNRSGVCIFKLFIDIDAKIKRTAQKVQI